MALRTIILFNYLKRRGYRVDNGNCSLCLYSRNWAEINIFNYALHDLGWDNINRSGYNIRNNLNRDGRRKGGDKSQREVIGSVGESEKNLTKQNEQLRNSLNGITAANETLLKSNEALREQLSVYERGLNEKQDELTD